MAILESQCVVSPDNPRRLDRIVQGLIHGSRADVRGLFDHGCVQLNGTECSEPGAAVKAGDVVQVRYDPHVRYHERPPVRESAAFRLVFEDDDLLVVDKAASVLTVPTDRGQTNTLLDAVNRHLSRRRRRAAVVHRLDRDTSGLLVFGKNPQTARALRAQFAVHKTEREYAAIVAGSLSQPRGTFSTRLATTKSLQRYSVREGEDGESAVTHFRVEQRLDGATYVRVWLETGRRNQIRVHFAEAGHPVLGDERYRVDLAQHPNWVAKRLALNAAILGFEHPRTGCALRFESPLPREMERFLYKRR